ncbi:MAG: sigma-54-dependent transcriptional regulator [Gemmatimonadota bacterium]
MPRPKFVTLIVEDDDGLRSALEESFSRRGHQVVGAPGVAEAVRLLTERNVGLVLLDLKLQDGSGLEVLRAARDLDEEIIVIMMTAFPEVRTAVGAMREGAADFITKPFELDQLHLAAERALEIRRLRRDVRRLDRERRRGREGTRMLGESAAIDAVHRDIGRVAETDTPVLITGETGTGKELVAEAIHQSSGRAEAPLVKVNCSAIAHQLLESELFGHERGAFTDAKESRIGLFEMADGGSLFLDEISEMQVELQAKLLRVVEGQPFRRVGGRREVRTDVRIVAATNRDLASRIQDGRFREDLYFRLNAFQIAVPPLRERGSDVGLLARHFLGRSARDLRREPLQLSAEAEQMLLAYAWPGNVRELRNVMERAAIVCDTDVVDVEHLPRELQAGAFVRHQTAGSESSTLPPLSEIERRYIDFVCRQTDGNISKAARILGVARNTLKARLRSAAESSER